MGKPILVTGMPRSGTTFTGKLLSKNRRIFNIGEPFRHKIPIDHHYPYYKSENSIGQSYSEIFEKIIKYKFLLRYRIENVDYSSLTSIRRGLIGSRGSYEYFRGWLFENILEKRGRILIKEPHALMISLSAAKYHNTKVVVLVRHPGGQVSSKLSLGWTNRRDRPRSLLDQPRLIDEHLPWLPEAVEGKERSAVEDLGIMWRAQHTVLLNFLDKVQEEDGLKIVRHEDICSSPVRRFAELYEWANIPWTSEVKEKIIDHTADENPSERSAKHDVHQHSNKRDSESLISIWKDRLNNKEIKKLREVTEPVASKFYSEETWRS